MVGFSPGADVFSVASQPRRFVAQVDKEIEGLGCLLGICPEFAWNSEFTRKSSGGGTEGGAILLHFCGSPGPSFKQENEPFLP